MKKLIYICVNIFFLFTFNIFTADAQQAFYIYRNDGHINTFITTDVDSMIYSRIDVDSILHDKYVVSEVYTQDSIYRIPLEVIDSVGFVTPKTVYKSGVIKLDGEIRDYIVASDSLTIYLKPNTPANMQPTIGKYLFTEEISNIFPSAFIGQVKNIKNENNFIIVECSRVNFEDVFEYYYYILNDKTKENSQAKDSEKRNVIWEKTWTPGTINFPMTEIITPMINPDPLGDLAFQANDTLDISLTPTYKVKYVRIVNPNYGTCVSIDFTEESMLSEEIGMSSRINWSKDFPEEGINIPLTELGLPGVNVHARAGVCINAQATICTEAFFCQNYRYTLHLESNSRNLFKPKFLLKNPHLVNEDPKGQTMLKGEVSLGIFGEIGIDFIDKDIASVGFRLEGGTRIKSNTMLYKKDIDKGLQSTNLYKALQGNHVSFNGYFDIGLPVKILWFSWENGIISLEKEFARINLVPTFSNTTLKRNSNNEMTLLASTKASGKCFPMDLGFTLFEKNSNDGIKEYSTYAYTGPSSNISSLFFNQSASNEYEVYPTVNLFGFEMLAEPSANLDSRICIDDNHPHIIDLGLPSSINWSCCNLGNENPVEYGNYYAWGETEAKDNYSWDTYFDNPNGSDGEWTGCSVTYDIAGSEYDAASAELGSTWRLPTKDEMQELVDRCTWEWSEINGVKGYKVTGPNENYIFLPAAGNADGYNITNTGTYGGYWTSTPNNDNSKAMAGSLYFYGSDSTSLYNVSWNNRYNGRSIRPVTP